MAAMLLDPHVQHPLGLGAYPSWEPEGRNPFAKKKPGQGVGCFIWPRDVKMKGTPLKSARRWKDIFTGKGPPVYYGHRHRFGPTKNVWSNWVDPQLDNLGYLDLEFEDLPDPKDTRKYDFKNRRFTSRWLRPEVWSDVKWGKDKQIPLYYRDGWGREFTKRLGAVRPFDEGEFGNDFRYRWNTENWDWANPWPQAEWQFLDV